MIRKPSTRDVSALEWFTSSYSDSSNPSDCVQVATTPDTVHIRDSKDVQGPLLALTPAAWVRFVPYAAGYASGR
ncbi:DUF397 domain-containing protein [Streptomyces sp. NBC_00654]|uniref:DUF397 domain-containing protein n=1 Tax=Streptomyces sp. NBC_00654 TaxID=2975799 RepID=UPI00225B2543|nr:DUF397 domain-containing protein [Streptomyces sp. NBC_00654]MCX4969901.1 DUF397 domain-containing protein [Streptomyces sp. NBC_00654]